MRDSWQKGYLGNVSLSSLLHFSNHGRGTFDCVNGKLMCLDGKAYQASSTGEKAKGPG